MKERRVIKKNRVCRRAKRIAVFVVFLMLTIPWMGAIKNTKAEGGANDIIVPIGEEWSNDDLKDPAKVDATQIEYISSSGYYLLHVNITIRGKLTLSSAVFKIDEDCGISVEKGNEGETYYNGTFIADGCTFTNSTIDKYWKGIEIKSNRVRISKSIISNSEIGVNSSNSHEVKVEIPAMDGNYGTDSCYKLGSNYFEEMTHNDIWVGKSLDQTRIYRGWSKFDMCEIPNDAIISDVDLTMTVSSKSQSGSHETEICQVINNIDQNSNWQTIYGDCADGNVYVSNSDALTTTGNKFFTNMGDQVVTDVQNSLSNDLFIIGVHEIDDNDYYGKVYGNEDETNLPKLNITYHAYPKLIGNTIINNYIGVKSIGNNLSIEGCLISDNDYAGLVFEGKNDTDRPSEPNISKNVITSNPVGILCNESSPEIKSCRVFNNEDYDFDINDVENEGSHLIANDTIVYDNNYDNNVNIDTNSDITVIRTLNITVKDEDNQPISNANVIINNTKETHDTIYEGLTDANGNVSNLGVTLYVLNNGGRTNSTPHLIYANHGYWGNNKIRTHILPDITPREVTIYLGNDNDGDGLTDREEEYLYFTDPENSDTDEDGLSDGKELGITLDLKPSGSSFSSYDDDNSTTTNPLCNDTDGDGFLDSEDKPNIHNGNPDTNPNIYWFEAEDLPVNSTRIVTHKVEGYSDIQTEIEAVNCSSTSGPLFLTSYSPVGTYKVYFRANSSHEESGEIRLSMLNPDWSTAYSFDFLVNRNYRWYSVSQFSVPEKVSDRNLSIKLEGIDGIVNVDKIMLTKILDRDGKDTGIDWGQITDDNCVDTDWDRQKDTKEVNTNIYWFEAEDFAFDPRAEENVIMDSNASSNRAYILQNDNFFNTFTLRDMDIGIYTLYFRARAKEGDTELRVAAGNINQTFDLKEVFNEPIYKWQKLEGIEIYDTTVFINLSLPDGGTAYIDKIMFAKTEDDIGPTYIEFDKVSDPLDPDTDFDSIPDGDEINGYFTYERENVDVNLSSEGVHYPNNHVWNNIDLDDYQNYRFKIVGESIENFDYYTTPPWPDHLDKKENIFKNIEIMFNEFGPFTPTEDFIADNILHTGSKISNNTNDVRNFTDEEESVRWEKAGLPKLIIDLDDTGDPTPYRNETNVIIFNFTVKNEGNVYAQNVKVFGRGQNTHVAGVSSSQDLNISDQKGFSVNIKMRDDREDHFFFTATCNNGTSIEISCTSSESVPYIEIDFPIDGQTVYNSTPVISGSSGAVITKLEYKLDYWREYKVLPAEWVLIDNYNFKFMVPKLVDGDHTIWIKATFADENVTINRTRFKVDTEKLGMSLIPETPVADGERAKLIINLNDGLGQPMDGITVNLDSDSANFYEEEEGGSSIDTIVTVDGMATVWVECTSTGIVEVTVSVTIDPDFPGIPIDFIDESIFTALTEIMFIPTSPSPTGTVYTNPDPQPPIRAGDVEHYNITIDVSQDIPNLKVDVSSNRNVEGKIVDFITEPPLTDDNGNTYVHVSSETPGTPTITAKIADLEIGSKVITFTQATRVTEGRYLAFYKNITTASYPNSITITLQPTIAPNEGTTYEFHIDYLSIAKIGLNPLNWDTDSDLLSDGEEVAKGSSPFLKDTDGDGLEDGNETYKHKTDPTLKDTDDDGLDDDKEIDNTDPLNPDTDNDGYLDGEEDDNKDGDYDAGETDPNDPDSDDDTMPDGWEVKFELDPISSADAILDDDSDGLNNSQEYSVDTNPCCIDSDGDGLSDYDEFYTVKFRTNIEKGARSVDEYDNANSSSWVYFREYAKSKGYYYQFKQCDSNIDISTTMYKGSPLYSKTDIVFDLLDGSTICFRNESYEHSDNSIYIWEPEADFMDEDENNTLEGKCYWFEYTTTNKLNPIFNLNKPIVYLLPFPTTYKNQELFYGGDPTNPDTDGDGVIDGDEPDWNNANDEYDDDNILNIEDTDSDGDGVEDGEERNEWGDIDKDGLVNIIDDDSDGDGIKDGTEINWDVNTDNDGKINMLDMDSDGDGICDGIEDRNKNGTTNYSKWSRETSQLFLDTDNDGLNDSEERVVVFRTNAESNGNGTLKYENGVYIGIPSISDIGDKIEGSGWKTTNKTRALENDVFELYAWDPTPQGDHVNNLSLLYGLYSPENFSVFYDDDPKEIKIECDYDTWYFEYAVPDPVPIDISPVPNSEYGEKNQESYIEWTNPRMQDTDGDSLTDYKEVNGHIISINDPYEMVIYEYEYGEGTATAMSIGGRVFFRTNAVYDEITKSFAFIEGTWLAIDPNPEDGNESLKGYGYHPSPEVLELPYPDYAAWIGTYLFSTPEGYPVTSYSDENHDVILIYYDLEGYQYHLYGDPFKYEPFCDEGNNADTNLFIDDEQEDALKNIFVTTNPKEKDSDGDNLEDDYEYGFTDASNGDTDGDGITDDKELRIIFRTNAEDNATLYDGDGEYDYDRGVHFAPIIYGRDDSTTNEDRVYVWSKFDSEVYATVDGIPTWISYVSDNTISISEDMIINEYETLYIEKGLSIEFAPDVGMIVNGTLIVNGTNDSTTDERVNFTGGGTQNQWKGIIFNNSGASGILNYTKFKDTPTPIFGNNSYYLNIRNSTFVGSASYNYGILCNNTYSVIINNTISGYSTGNGVWCTNNSTVFIIGNSISGNNIGILSDSYSEVNISFNDIYSNTEKNVDGGTLYNNYINDVVNTVVNVIWAEGNENKSAYGGGVGPRTSTGIYKTHDANPDGKLDYIKDTFIAMAFEPQGIITGYEWDGRDLTKEYDEINIVGYTPEKYPILNYEEIPPCVYVFETNDFTTYWPVKYVKDDDLSGWPVFPYTLTPNKENLSLGTSPIDIDTDRDNLPDGWVDGWTKNESYPIAFYDDSGNKDENRDSWEGEDLDCDGIIDIDETDPRDSDTDDDLLLDGLETMEISSDPLKVDTDDDHLPDFIEYGYTNASNSDTDGDGLHDDKELEVVFRTNAEFVPGYGLDFSVSGTWVVLDCDDGGQSYSRDGELNIFEFCQYIQFGGEYDNYRQIYDVINQTKSEILTTTDGKPIFYFNPNIEIYNFSYNENNKIIAWYSVFNRHEELELEDEDTSIKPVLSYVSNHQEYYTERTDPNDKDTDGDNLPDGWIDGWINGTTSSTHENNTNESWEGEDLNCDGFVDVSETDPLNWDSDNDGLGDGMEYYYNSQVSNKWDELTDTEGEQYDFDLNSTEWRPYGITDLSHKYHFYNDSVKNLDNDGDGIMDNLDPDGDGKINPLDSDSDDDGIPDGEEDSNRNGVWDGTLLTEVISWEGSAINATPKIAYDNSSAYWKIRFKAKRLNDTSVTTWMKLTVHDFSGDYQTKVWNNEQIKPYYQWYTFEFLEMDGIDDPYVYLVPNDWSELHTQIEFTDFIVERKGLAFFDMDYDHPFFLNVTETNPYLNDSDLDGLEDGKEILDLGTNPLDWDTDGDLLADGAKYNATEEDYFMAGEDRNNDTIIDDDEETDPLNPDSDGDMVYDGYEYYLLRNLIKDELIDKMNAPYDEGYYDSDDDGIMDLREIDSDNDGLTDGEENFIFNCILDVDSSGRFIEANPADWDSDDDYLLDGAEAEWMNQTDSDGYINVWDQDTNIGVGDEPEGKHYIEYPTGGKRDYDDMYVVFRTDAEDSDGDGKFEYDDENIWIALDTERIADHTNATTVDLTIDAGDPVDVPDLKDYTYITSTTSISEDRIVTFNNSEYYTWLQTPDGYYVFVDGLVDYKSQGNWYDTVYIKISDSNYLKFEYENVTDDLSNHPLPTGYLNDQKDFNDHNYIANHQETYDPSVVLSMDMDLDGLTNDEEINAGTLPYDADTDNDGVIDGMELLWGEDSDGDGNINANDPDSDNDGIKDGTELGITVAHPGTDTGQGYFIPDEDVETITDPTNHDSDGDGLYDGFNDINGDGDRNSGEYGEDLNCDGKYDGFYDDDSEEYYGETDPLNQDTDFDGIWDGCEVAMGIKPYDADCDDDGILDGREYCRFQDYDGDGKIGILDPDSDNDGIPDGTEIGIDIDSKIPDCESEDEVILYYYGTNTTTFDISYLPEYITDAFGQNRDTFIVDLDNSTTTNILRSDSDFDGLIDGVEDKNCDGIYNKDIYPCNKFAETDPLNRDTDFDGIKDGSEDLNEDGLFDEEEGESNPLDADTDDDGLKDGEEKYNLGTDPTDWDSDDDWVHDGTELGVTEGVVGGEGFLGTDLKYFVPDADPTTKTEPDNPDTDEDGLNDGWFDCNGDGVRDEKGEDLDGNGKVDPNYELGSWYLESDPNDKDSDDDGMSDGKEGQIDIDGDKLFNSVDTDSDNDGISDYDEDTTYDNKYYFIGERRYYLNLDPYDSDIDGDELLDGEELYEYGTNPCDEDTDGDKLWDGDELLGLELDDYDIWYKGEEHLSDPLQKDSDVDDLKDNEEIELQTDPLNPDTDGDKISDGDEVKGYNVEIQYYRGGNAYGVNKDGEEKYNIKGEIRKRQKAQQPTDPTFNNAGKRAAWGNYEDELKFPFDFDGDGLSNFQEEDYYSQYESMGDDCAKGYAATVVDATPPKITKIDVDEDTEYTSYGKAEHTWVEFGVHISEDFGIEKVRVKIIDKDQVNYTYPKKDSQGHYPQGDWIIYVKGFDVDYWGDKMWDYKINVTVWDANDNSMSREKKIEGSLKKIVDAFVGAIKNIAKAAFEFFIGGIWELIEKIFSPLLNEIKDTIENYKTDVKNAYDDATSGGCTVKEAASLIYHALFGKLFLILLGIIILVKIVSYIVQAFLFMLGGLDVIVQFVIGIITMAVVAQVLNGVIDKVNGDSASEVIGERVGTVGTGLSFTKLLVSIGLLVGKVKAKTAAFMDSFWVAWSIISTLLSKMVEPINYFGTFMSIISFIKTFSGVYSKPTLWGKFKLVISTVCLSFTIAKTGIKLSN